METFQIDDAARDKWRRERLGDGYYVYLSDLHTFGTDALLLGAFAAPKKTETVCDLGTGCGILPMLWCRDGRAKTVAAVDISPAACLQCQTAVEEQGLREKVTAVCADLRDLPKEFLPGSFDLVTMNPPYQANNSGQQNPDAARRIARHEVLCSIEEIARSAARLLKFGGRFCLCQRPDRLADVICAMREANLEIKRLRFVALSPGHAPWLLLAEGKKGGKPGMTVMPVLYQKDADGADTAEITEVYGKYRN